MGVQDASRRSAAGCTCSSFPTGCRRRVTSVLRRASAQLHGRAGSDRIHAASTANGIGVPLRDGRTSHAVALAITLCRCRRPVHRARAVDARVPIIARLRTPHSMVRGRRTHHRRGRTPSCRRPRPHLDRSPPRRSLTTARGLVVLASLRLTLRLSGQPERPSASLEWTRIVDDRVLLSSGPGSCCWPGSGHGAVDASGVTCAPLRVGAQSVLVDQVRAPAQAARGCPGPRGT